MSAYHVPDFAVQNQRGGRAVTCHEDVSPADHRVLGTKISRCRLRLAVIALIPELILCAVAGGESYPRHCLLIFGRTLGAARGSPSFPARIPALQDSGAVTRL